MTVVDNAQPSAKGQPSRRAPLQFGVLQFFSWPNRAVPLQTVYARALERIDMMERSGGYEAVWLAEEIVGHPLWGHVSKTGPRPRYGRRYPMDMPFVETHEQARHFIKGPSVYAGSLSPWKEPITSYQRPETQAPPRNGHAPNSTASAAKPVGSAAAKG